MLRSKKLPDSQLRPNNRESLLRKPHSSPLKRLLLRRLLKLLALLLRQKLPDLLKRLLPLKLLALLPKKRLPEPLLSRLPLLPLLKLPELLLKKRLLELPPSRPLLLRLLRLLDLLLRPRLPELLLNKLPLLRLLRMHRSLLRLPQLRLRKMLASLPFKPPLLRLSRKLVSLRRHVLLSNRLLSPLLRLRLIASPLKRLLPPRLLPSNKPLRRQESLLKRPNSHR